MDNDDFLNEYLADMDCAALPHILQDEPASGGPTAADLSAHGTSQPLTDLAAAKGLFDDTDMANTVAPSWLSGPQFEPTSNPESTGSPSPEFSGDVDDTLGLASHTDLLFPMLPPTDRSASASGSSNAGLKTESPAEAVALPMLPDSSSATDNNKTPGVHFKQEEPDHVPLSPAASEMLKSSPKRKRKRPFATIGDKARRQKFLERNRVAASKCRRKKKEAEQVLEADQKRLEEENTVLKTTLSALTDEFIDLRNKMIAHRTCGKPETTNWLSNRVDRLENIIGNERLEAELNRRREAQAQATNLPPGAAGLVVAGPAGPAGQVVSVGTAGPAGPAGSAAPPQMQTAPPLISLPQVGCSGISMAAVPFSAATAAHPLVTTAYSTPPLQPGDIPMIAQAPNKHARNASLASSMASMTSYASSNFASDMDSGRKSSSGSSFDLSPISPLYAEFTDSLPPDSIKPDETMEPLDDMNDMLFDSM